RIPRGPSGGAGEPGSGGIALRLLAGAGHGYPSLDARFTWDSRRRRRSGRPCKRRGTSTSARSTLRGRVREDELDVRQVPFRELAPQVPPHRFLPLRLVLVLEGLREDRRNQSRLPDDIHVLHSAGESPQSTFEAFSRQHVDSREFSTAPPNPRTASS